MTSACPAITLLTQPNCTLCEQAKRVLTRVARDIPLTVTEVELTSGEGRTLATEADILFAPGVLLDGELFSYGRLSERKLRKTLTARTAPSPPCAC